MLLVRNTDIVNPRSLAPAKAAHVNTRVRALPAPVRMDAVLVVMRKDATEEQVRGVTRAIEARGYRAHPIPGAQRTAIGVTGNKGALEAPVFESLPGVLEVIPVSHAYKLVSREAKSEDSRGAGGRRWRSAGPSSC